MTLAIFDLDNTLLGGDSDHAWGEFVCEQGIVDADKFASHNDAFYRDYQTGTLDIDAYLRFTLSALAGQSLEQVQAWHSLFMQVKIAPMMLPKAKQLIEDHRSAGDQLLIITATSAFITRPIAQLLGIPDLIACEAEVINGRYTGAPTGVPTYREGKVTRFKTWLEKREVDSSGAWFYSDSHNDIALLDLVDQPVAVDPDNTLRSYATSKGWPVISLRES